MGLEVVSAVKTEPIQEQLRTDTKYMFPSDVGIIIALVQESIGAEHILL